jgi:DNA-binding MarR family transcriptional regulator
MSSTPRDDLAAALHASVRRLSDAVSLYEGAVAEHLGMHATDLHFLDLVHEHGPTTPGHLAELGALTTGAVTGVLDRLEQAGYVRREPDPADRRRVVVRLVDERAAAIGLVHEPLRAASTHVEERYSDDDLATILDYADRLRPVLDERTARLRDETARSAAPVRRAATGDGPVSAPLAGLSTAVLRFPGGVGDVRVRGDHAITNLFEGDLQAASANAKVDRGVVSIHFRRSPFGRRANPSELLLNTSVAWQLELTGGCRRFDALLRDIEVTGITITGGISHAVVELPAPRGVVPVRLTGGVNDLTITRPVGTAARMKVRGGAVNVTFDNQRYGVVGGEHTWRSPEGADGDADRYEVEIVGGARTITVTTA